MVLNGSNCSPRKDISQGYILIRGVVILSLDGKMTLNLGWLGENSLQNLFPRLSDISEVSL